MRREVEKGLRRRADRESVQVDRHRIADPVSTDASADGSRRVRRNGDVHIATGRYNATPQLCRGVVTDVRPGCREIDCRFRAEASADGHLSEDVPIVEELAEPRSQEFGKRNSGSTRVGATERLSRIEG